MTFHSLMLPYHEVCAVTCAWVIMAYVQMPMGPTSGMTGRSPGQQKWGNRIFMNMQEQAPLFLASLWAFAIVLTPDRAAMLGWTYLGLRALYAPIWMILGGEGGAPFPQMFVSTFPQYAINFYMALNVILAFGQTEDMKDWFKHDLVGVLILTIVYMGYAVGITPLINKGVTGFFAAPAAGETPAGAV